MKHIERISEKFTIGSTEFTVTIDNSLILICANDNPFSNFSVWNEEIQKAALKELGNSKLL